MGIMNKYGCSSCEWQSDYLYEGGGMTFGSLGVTGFCSKCQEITNSVEIVNQGDDPLKNLACYSCNGDLKLWDRNCPKCSQPADQLGMSGLWD